MARIITNRAELKRRSELMRVAIEKRAVERVAASQRVVPAAPPLSVDGGRPAARVQRAKTHMVDGWLQAHAAVHKMRFRELVREKGPRAWIIDCDACGNQLARVGCIGNLEGHLKSAKHVNALSANDNPATRVVQHRRENRVDTWLQEHAAVHKLRFTEGAAGNQGMRTWNVECDACGSQMSGVRHVSNLKNHLKCAKHVNALPADDGPAISQTHLNGKALAGTRSAGAQRKRPRA
jgi:hypothetical protein